ncbi:MAG: pyrophosphohydrolase [archaeon]|nr:MAG: pyrophosphohydrolase [archaeon]
MKLRNGATLKEVQEYIKTVLRERGFDKETTVEKCLLLGEEIGELYKAVRKTQGVKSDDSSRFGKIEHELADIFMYTLDIANKCGIDLEEALRSKEEVNKKRSWK